MEKQMLIYSHQLDVLMQSEEKVKALRHDLKNHLGELAFMAGNQNNEEIQYGRQAKTEIQPIA